MSRMRRTLCRLVLATGVRSSVLAPSSARLLVVNYHRLWPMSGASSRFDDGVFDTDVETFRRQMEWLKANTVVLDEEGLLQLATSDARRRGVIYSAVTFDDGYLDCTTLARPVLDEMGIRGIFFIPVEIVESRRLGWWDLAANALKRTARRSIVLDGVTYDLRGNFQGSLRCILNRFKLERADDTVMLLDKLAVACDTPLAFPEEQGAELMTWAQVRQLKAAGHAIGAHSLTHRVLATMDSAAQSLEIEGSRQALEAILGCRVTSFAYPVGGPAHINSHSVALARQAGFDLAFTFNTGMAALPIADPFQIPRESATTMELLVAKALLPGLMGLRMGLPVPTASLG